jgi:CubicO group peptidase (beta-lactamase class C family)
MKKLLRMITWILGVLLITALTAGAVWHNEVYRFYKVVTLFDEDQIVENFRNSSSIFPYHLVQKKGPAFRFGHTPQNLPQTFVYKQKTYDLFKLLEDTWTTGVSPATYLQEKIWKKIGMESDARWLCDDDDMELVFGTLNVTLRDYARFGRLYMNGGRWNDEQVVPAAWVTASTTPDAPHLMPGENPNSTSRMGYGYQWWIPENPDDDFMAIGVHGQFIYINPKRKVVIVKSSADPFWRSGSETNYAVVAGLQHIARSL